VYKRQEQFSALQYRYNQLEEHGSVSSGWRQTGSAP
jgi:hypothetical protein